MNGHTRTDHVGPRPFGSRLLNRALASALGVGLTLVIGGIVYLLWLLLSLYLSLNWQLAAGGAGDARNADATEWLQCATFVLAVCCVAAAVRTTLKFCVRDERFQHVCFTGLSVGAILGIVSAAFLNQNLRISPFPHLFVDVPEASIGWFWCLVPTIGVTFAFVGSFVGRHTFKE